MMDDIFGLSSGKRHVESVERNANLRIGREGPPDDASRSAVEDDYEVEEARERRRKVMSATHSSFGCSATTLRRTRSTAG
jgi:hypothetical protein